MKTCICDDCETNDSTIVVLAVTPARSRRIAFDPAVVLCTTCYRRLWADNCPDGGEIDSLPLLMVENRWTSEAGRLGLEAAEPLPAA
jgi:hypothetical protein